MDTNKVNQNRFYSMRNLAKMHYQLYMWLYCFQNYKVITVNVNLTISEKQVSFTLLATDEKILFSVVACIVFMRLSFSSSTFSRFIPYSVKNPNISEADECDSLFLFTCRLCLNPGSKESTESFLRWMWSGAWSKCKSWSDTCIVLYGLLHFHVSCTVPVCMLLSSISFCFLSGFLHLFKHWPPVSFISGGLSNSSAILSNTPFFALFHFPS